MFKEEDAVIIENKKLTSDVFKLKLKAFYVASNIQAGQFVMLNCGFGNDPFLKRPFSVAIKDESNITILYKKVKKGTTILSMLKERDILNITGPLGKPFKTSKGAFSLLVAGGIGIAPLLFYAQNLLKAKSPFYLIWGIKDKSWEGLVNFIKTVIPKEYMSITSEDGSIGHKGNVYVLTNSVKNIISNSFPQKTIEVVACGPLPMLKELNILKKALNPLKVYVSLEKRMACGWGGCCGCSIKTKSGIKRVCKDGPVFEYEEVIWDEL